MPIAIHIEADTGIAIASCSGVLRLADARYMVTTLWRTAGWGKRAAVWDFRSSAFDMSPSDIRALARFVLHHQPTPPPAKVAFVTARDVDFGMARMFEVFRSDPRTEFCVFRAFDDAVRWARPHAPGAAGST